jgi:hypothetical protein
MLGKGHGVPTTNRAEGGQSLVEKTTNTHALKGALSAASSPRHEESISPGASCFLWARSFPPFDPPLPRLPSSSLRLARFPSLSDTPYPLPAFPVCFRPTHLFCPIACASFRPGAAASATRAVASTVLQVAEALPHRRAGTAAVRTAVLRQQARPSASTTAAAAATTGTTSGRGTKRLLSCILDLVGRRDGSRNRRVMDCQCSIGACA